MKTKFMLLALCLTTFVGMAQKPEKARVESDYAPTVKRVEFQNSVTPKIKSTLKDAKALGANSEEVKVLRTIKLTDEISQQIVENSRGIVYKRVVKNGVPVRVTNLKRQTLSYVPKDENATVLWEDFESYTGDGYDDELPEGWGEKVHPGNEFVGDTTYIYYDPETGEPVDTAEIFSRNNTWAMGPSDTWGFLPHTPDGDIEVSVHFPCEAYYYPEGTDDEGYDLPPVIVVDKAEQDEWLITPDLHIANELQNLYFLFGMDYAGIYHLDYATMTYDRSAFEYNVSVLVKEKGKEDILENWEVIFSAEDSVKNLTDRELYALPFEYVEHSLSLAKYVGKDINIAFRHEIPYTKNLAGNTTLLDAVMVGPKKLDASYAKSQGDFYVGLSKEFYNISENVILGPAYVDRTFKNTTVAKDVNYNWTYFNADGDKVNSSEKDIVVNYPALASVPVPELEVTYEGSVPANYKWGVVKAYDQNNPQIMSGGDMEIDGMLFGLGTYDLSLGLGCYRGSETEYLFGIPSWWDWRYVVGGPNTVAAISQYIEKPLQPYVLKNLWISLYAFHAADDAEFLLKIQAVNEYNVPQETLATAKCTARDVQTVNLGGGTVFYNMPFDQLMKDDEEILSLLIDQPVMITLSGLDSEKVEEFAAFNQNNTSNTDVCNAYVTFAVDDYDETTPLEYKIYSADDLLEDGMISFYFTLNASYPFLHAEESVLKLDKNGTKSVLDIISYYTSSGWTIKEEIPSWLKISYNDPEGAWSQIVAEAEPLAEGTREFKFTLSSVNVVDPIEITVVQDVDYVDNEIVTEKTDYRVISNRAEWTVIYPETVKTIKLVDMSGRTINTWNAATFNGSMNVSKETLSSGLYFFMFDNNAVVKAIR